jgi:hypothetical protein
MSMWFWEMMNNNKNGSKLGCSNFFFVFQKFTNTIEDPYYWILSILLTKWKNGDGKEKRNYDECKSIEVFKWVQTS